MRCVSGGCLDLFTNATHDAIRLRASAFLLCVCVSDVCVRFMQDACARTNKYKRVLAPPEVNFVQQTG